MMCLKADWFVALGTFLVAFVAVFQEWIKSLWWKPELIVDIKTEPPYCHMTELIGKEKEVEFRCDCLYLWLKVENKGSVVARSVEVYAKQLKIKVNDKTWEIVPTFPPMNLQWAHTRGMFFPRISPKMEKHCVLGHISDPSNRPKNEVNPSLKLESGNTSFFFELIVSPNHKGHIVGPGLYNLLIQVAAENHKPLEKIVELNITGVWDNEADVKQGKVAKVNMLDDSEIPRRFKADLMT